MSLKNQIKGVILGLTLVFLVSGCGSGVQGGVGGNLIPNVTRVGTSGQTAPFFKVLTEINGPIGALTALSGWVSAITVGSRSGRNVGQTFSSADLLSLKYFIQNIQLCENIDVSGSGYSGTTHCVSIYENPALASIDLNGTSFYDNYTVTQALSDPAAEVRFVDVMTSEGLDKLRAPIVVSDTMKGTYRYGLVSFFRTIRMKAHFRETNGGSILYRTRANKTVYKTGHDDSRTVEYVEMGSMTESPESAPEEVTYMLNNGGQYFRFNQPFTISNDDIVNQSNLKIDLVFNPDHFMTANPQGGDCDPNVAPSSGVDGNGSPPIYDNANCISVSPKFIKLTPVPRKGNEKARKEVYRIVNYKNSNGEFGNARIELYYNDGDPDKKIQGIDVSYEVSAASSVAPAGIEIASYDASETGGVVKLLDYDGSDSLTGLTRRADSAVTLTCRHEDASSGCMGTGATVRQNATYVGDFLVSTD